MMSTLADLARALNANWEQHAAADVEARHLLLAAREQMRLNVFEIWCAVHLKRPLHSIRACLASAQQSVQ
jgi:hypothetical protein